MRQVAYDATVKAAAVAYAFNKDSLLTQQQQYLFTVGGWKPEGHKPIKAGSNRHSNRITLRPRSTKITKCIIDLAA